MTRSLSSIEKSITLLERNRNQQDSKHIDVNDSRMIIYAGNQKKIYVPTATGLLAHNDNSFVRGIMGPFGSGKSTWAISEMVRRSCAMPIWDNGRRRSRWGIVRNTSGELQTTTLQTWLQWYGDLGDVKTNKKPILTHRHLFNDGKGIVDLELLFIALDRPDDVRKIKSLELTGCYFNEMSEIPKAAFSHMKGRVNRYPAKKFCPEPYWSGIIFDTNPPDEDHWIYKDFELSQSKDHKLFKQPPGLIRDEDNYWVRNPHADNVDNLVDHYYENLSGGQTEEFIKVFCLGQYGSVGTGKLVFPNFNTDLYVSREGLNAIQGEPIYLGWDFGLTPACIVIQITPRGRLLVLKEYVGEDMGIRTFAESIVIPGLAKDFPYNKIGRSIGDPAGSHRSEIMEEMSCIGELCQIGIETTSARTNDIDPRLGSIRYFLGKIIDGKPAFLLDRKQCPTLFKGFTKDYIYSRVAVAGEERYKDKPHKNMASHPMDALGYICLEFASDSIMQDKRTEKVIDIWNPVMRTF